MWTPVGDLSGGERRRLQMLRLLAGEPNVLLLDEPTNDLDTDTLASLEDLLDSWPGTMIVASHDRYLVERVTDTVYGMFGDGRLRAPARRRRRVPGPGRRAGRRRGAAPAARRDRPPACPPASCAPPARSWPGWNGSSASWSSGRRKLHDELAAHATDYEKIAELDAELKAVRAERAQVEEAWLALAERVPES